MNRRSGSVWNILHRKPGSLACIGPLHAKCRVHPRPRRAERGVPQMERLSPGEARSKWPCRSLPCPRTPVEVVYPNVVWERPAICPSQWVGAWQQPPPPPATPAGPQPRHLLSSSCCRQDLASGWWSPGRGQPGLRNTTRWCPLCPQVHPHCGGQCCWEPVIGHLVDLRPWGGKLCWLSHWSRCLVRGGRMCQVTDGGSQVGLTHQIGRTRSRRDASRMGAWTAGPPAPGSSPNSVCQARAATGDPC